MQTLHERTFCFRIGKRAVAGAFTFISFLLPGMATLYAQQQEARVGVSPWGAKDEIGTLNLLSDSNNLALFKRVNSGKVFDLGVEYFVGMPGFTELDDPGYQFWLTHSPR